MVSAVSGGSTLPVAPPESAEESKETKETESAKAAEPSTSAPEPQRTDGAAQKAESSIAAQAQAAQLHSQIPQAMQASAGQAPPSTDAAAAAPAVPTAAPTSGASSAESPAAVEEPPQLLIKDSVGPKVEKFQKDLNEWRVANGKPAITADGTYGDETELAVEDFRKTMGINQDGKAASSTHERLQLENNPNYKKLAPETKEEVRKQFNQYEKEKNPDAKDNLKMLTSDPAISALPKDAQLSALKAFSMQPNSAAQTDSIAQLAGNPIVQKVDDATKNQLFEMVAKNGSNVHYITPLYAYVNHENFVKMAPADRQKSLSLFESAPHSTQYSLIGLMKKSVNGQPILASKASDGTTTAENLDRLAKTPLNPELKDAALHPQDKAKLMEDLISELNNPSQTINQGDRGTCTVASMTSNLATKNPAEYARLVTDLSTKGHAKLANGDTMTPPDDGFREDNSSRSVGERLLQSSLMNNGRPWDKYQNWNPGPDGERGTPDDGQFDPTNPTSVRRDVFKEPQNSPPHNDFQNGGLRGPEELRVLEALHGKKFEQNTDKLLERTQKQISEGKSPVYTSVVWGDVNNTDPKKTEGHAIEVTKIENGRVYFRNPWGPGAVGPTDPPTETGLNRTPPRRTEDGPNGIQSMTIEEYQKRAYQITTEK